MDKWLRILQPFIVKAHVEADHLSTGMALGWIGATTSLGSVVRKPNRSFVVSPSFTFRTHVQLTQMPANTANGRVSSSANQMPPP